MENDTNLTVPASGQYIHENVSNEDAEGIINDFEMSLETTSAEPSSETSADNALISNVYMAPTSPEAEEVRATDDELLASLGGIEEDNDEEDSDYADTEEHDDELPEPIQENDEQMSSDTSEGTQASPNGTIQNMSTTLITPEYDLRFSGADWYEDVKSLRVSLIGLGGIGSWTALLLSRLGINSLITYDFDRVESTNLAGQLYSHSMIGKTKTEATSRNIRSYSSYTEIMSMCERYSNQSLHKITICGLDNMSTRRVAFNNWWNQYKGDQSALFIDGRLLLEELQILSLRGNDSENRKNYLANYMFDDKAENEPACTVKQTSFTASMIASLICSIIVNHLRGLKTGEPIPFFTYFNVNGFMFKQEY